MASAISPGPLIGAVLKRRNLRTVTITETSYAPNLVIGKHAHPFPYFCAVLQGSFDDSVGPNQRLLHDSSVFFRPAEEVHADKFRHHGARCLAVELKPELMERLEMKAFRLKESRHFSGGALFSLSRRLQAELERWDEFSALSAEGLVYELISEAFRSSSISRMTGPQWLRAATEFVTINFRESLKLSEIADAVRVHPAHLARSFRKVHGCTVGDYIRRQRIQFCCDQLAQTELSLSAIALEAGFADQSHFCRTFKRQVGESPASYRRQFLKRGC